MDYEEALAWLQGERSMTNDLMGLEPGDDRQRTLVFIQQADAALTQQAYYVVKAHAEGLVK